MSEFTTLVGKEDATLLGVHNLAQAIMYFQYCPRPMLRWRLRASLAFGHDSQALRVASKMLDALQAEYPFEQRLPGPGHAHNCDYVTSGQHAGCTCDLRYRKED